MPSDTSWVRFKRGLASLRHHRPPLALSMTAILLGWLALIATLHLMINADREQRRVIRMGYMPVVTNLAAPILDHITRKTGTVRYQAVKFASFAEMAEALRNDQIQAAFMIAPLSIVLRQQGEQVRIVYIGNRHESTLVVRSDLNAERLQDLAGRTIAVPMRFSGHCLGLRRLMEQNGLENRIRLVEMNPPDMAAALTVGALDGYFVGEPFAAQAVRSGDARVLYYVEDIWKHFICNLMLIKHEWIESHPEIVQNLVAGAARAGIWARMHPDRAARIASGYWNQPVDLVEYALTRPPGRVVYDRFTPVAAEIQQLADLMVRYEMIASADIANLVEDRFARKTSLAGITDLNSVLDLNRVDADIAKTDGPGPVRAGEDEHGNP